MPTINTNPANTGQNTANFLGSKENQAKIHEFVQKQVTEAIYEEDPFTGVFKEEFIPEHQGKTMIIRKKDKYDATINAYGEGAEITVDSPQTETELRVALKGISGVAMYTDEAVRFSRDGMSLINDITEGQSHSVAEKLATLKYNALKSTENVWFMGATPDNDDNLADALGDCTAFDLDELRKIKVALKRMNVKPFKDGFYYLYLTPEIVSDMFSLAKSDTKYSFVELMMQNNANAIKEGALGDWNGFRFFENNLITSFKSGSNDITACIVLGTYAGEKGAVEVKPEGMGSVKAIHHPIGSSGVFDALDTQGSIGWKKYIGYAIKHPEAVMKIYCKNSAGASTYQQFPDSISMPLTAETVRKISGNKNETLTATTNGTGTAQATTKRFENGSAVTSTRADS